MAACFLTGSFFAVRAFQADVPSAFPAAKADIQTSDAAAITPYAESQSELITQNIEDIRLGQRVVGTNPLREQTQPASDIQPDTWRTVRLTMFKTGVTYDLAFLRPLSWLGSKGAKVGGSVHMELDELGLNGPAEVVGIGPCPDIEPDDGTGRNVVTGTMGHPGPNVVYLDITGLNEPLGVTDTHPIWSETRQDFIQAGFLKIGEQFRTLTGEAATLTKITPHRGPPKMVFNLEVDSEHVYSVAGGGLLVHNSGCAPKGERVYEHLDEAGDVNYIGITDDLKRRAGQHRLDEAKTGLSMKPTTDALTHDQSRTIEAMKIRQRLAEARAEGLIDGTESVAEQLQEAGLLNQNRGRDPSRWVDIDPDDFIKDFDDIFDIRTPNGG